MRKRAIQKLLVGLLVSFACELARAIWQTAQKKDHEGVHDCKRSELTKRGGTDQWELSK